MGLKLSNWWKDLIIKLLLLYAALKVISGVFWIIQTYFNNDNPLIPDYLIRHMIFPYYFLIPLWTIGVWFYYSVLKTKKYGKNQFWVMPFSLIALWGIEILIFQLSLLIKPFG